jgi:hypothetical protein
MSPEQQSYGSAMIDRDDLLELAGYDVLEVGVRQAWPFITFGAPTSERTERRLFIDADFSLSDAAGAAIGGTVLARLEPLVLRIVVEVRLAETALTLRFDDGAELKVSNVATPETIGPPFWLGDNAE